MECNLNSFDAPSLTEREKINYIFAFDTVRAKLGSSLALHSSVMYSAGCSEDGRQSFEEAKDLPQPIRVANV